MKTIIVLFSLVNTCVSTQTLLIILRQTKTLIHTEYRGMPDVT